MLKSANSCLTRPSGDAAAAPSSPAAAVVPARADEERGHRQRKRSRNGIVRKSQNFRVFGELPAELGPETPWSGSGPKNGAERAQN